MQEVRRARTTRPGASGAPPPTRPNQDIRARLPSPWASGAADTETHEAPPVHSSTRRAPETAEALRRPAPPEVEPWEGRPEGMQEAARETQRGPVKHTPGPWCRGRSEHATTSVGGQRVRSIDGRVQSSCGGHAACQACRQTSERHTIVCHDDRARQSRPRELRRTAPPDGRRPPR